MRRTLSRCAAVLGSVLILTGVVQLVVAATPSEGKLTPTSRTLSWTGGPLVGSAAALRRITCNPSTCDDFLLDVDLPRSAFPGKLPVMKLTLETTAPNLMDIVVCKPGACKDVNTADYEVFSASDPGGVARASIQEPLKGTWKIRAGCTACAGATYTLTADVVTVPIPGSHAPNFDNLTLPGLTPDEPVGAAEPGIRLGPKGEVWIDGPGGKADFWGSYDGGKSFTLHQPDQDNAPGDTWLTIGPDGTIYADNLVITYAVGNLVYVSKDEGKTWTTSGFPANIDSDRQWLTADPKQAGVVYFTYHDIADPLIWVWKTTDYAQTWTPIASISLQEVTGLGKFDSMGGNTSGPIEIAPDGTMYLTVTFNDFIEATTALPTRQDFDISRIYVLHSTDGGVNWTFSLPVDRYQKGTTHHGHAKLTHDRVGNVYLVWSERPIDDVTTDAFLMTSTDKGTTWSEAKQVSTNGASNIFATAAAKGDAGKIDIAWLESSSKDFNDHASEWRVVMAQSFDALSAHPTWTKMQVSPDVMHRADVCQAGTLCLVTGGNRNLLDFIWMDIDDKGMAHVAYANDLGGVRTVYAKQIAGAGTVAAKVQGRKITKPAPPVSRPGRLPATGVSTGASGLALLLAAAILRRSLRPAR